MARARPARAGRAAARGAGARSCAPRCPRCARHAGVARRWARGAARAHPDADSALVVATREQRCAPAARRARPAHNAHGRVVPDERSDGGMARQSLVLARAGAACAAFARVAGGVVRGSEIPQAHVARRAPRREQPAATSTAPRDTKPAARWRHEYRTRRERERGREAAIARRQRARVRHGEDVHRTAAECSSEQPEPAQFSALAARAPVELPCAAAIVCDAHDQLRGARGAVCLALGAWSRVRHPVGIGANAAHARRAVRAVPWRAVRCTQRPQLERVAAAHGLRSGLPPHRAAQRAHRHVLLLRKLVHRVATRLAARRAAPPRCARAERRPRDRTHWPRRVERDAKAHARRRAQLGGTEGPQPQRRAG